MRMVKCQICGKLIEQSQAYSIKYGTANKYYCSEQEYIADKKAKSDRKEMVGKIAGVYQYCTDYAEPPYTLVAREIGDNLKVIPIETIAAFVEENKDRLRATVRKKIELNGPFESFYFEVRYISGIIKREILEKDWKSKQVVVNSSTIKPYEAEFYNGGEIKNSYVSKRRSLEQLELEAVEDDD